MSLVNMKMSKEEAKEEMQPTAADAPEYPYGLTIDIDDDGLTKLGITELPKVGTEMMLTAGVVVSSTRSYNTQGGDPETGVCLQITDMELGAAAARPDTTSVLYKS